MTSFAFFRLIHLPHHAHPITATSASRTPATVPPAIAATGTSERFCCEMAAAVGREPVPPLVMVVVTTSWEAIMAVVVRVDVGVKTPEELWVAFA